MNAQLTASFQDFFSNHKDGWFYGDSVQRHESAYLQIEKKAHYKKGIQYYVGLVNENGVEYRSYVGEGDFRWI